MINNEKKTLIGILASHDNKEMNNNLVTLLDSLVEEDGKRKNQILNRYMFIFTGGTFDRVILGTSDQTLGTSDPLTLIKIKRVKEDTRNYLLNECGVIRLPTGIDGGVIILSYLVVKKILSIIWFFLSPATAHLLKSDNLALMRLCDQWSVKRLMNVGSIIEWYLQESNKDINFNSKEKLQYILLKEWPLSRNVPNDLRTNIKIWVIKTISIYFDIDQQKIKIKNEKGEFQREINYERGYAETDNYFDGKANPPENYEIKCDKYYELENPPEDKISVKSAKEKNQNENPFAYKTIALISHDAMKERMVEFVIYYERELNKFGRIIATGTTGKLIQDATPSLKNIIRCYSGPKGGDIEIATEILYNKCDIVIFFIDPLNPHPHIDDIRVVFYACMRKYNVLMLSNEIHAREWFETVIRKRGI